MVTVDELWNLYLDGKVKKYKDAWARGYVSRRTDGYVENYDGKYGKGYIWHKPTTRSTQYHIIEYYIVDNKLKGKHTISPKNKKLLYPKIGKSFKPAFTKKY